MGIRTLHRRTATGMRTLHRRTVMVTTVVVATATVAAAVVPVLFAPVPAVAAEAGTARLPGLVGSSRGEDREEDFGARLSRDLQAALSARPGTVLVSVPDDTSGDRARTTAGDRLRWPAVVAGAHAFLRAGACRLRVFTRLRDVRPRRVFFGPSRGPGAHITTGRLPRAANGGRVHGIGSFTGPARSYRVIVLSYDHPTTPYGARAVERFARAVHRGFFRGGGLFRGLTAGRAVSERRDGSAPYAPPRDRDEPERDATS
ncbi:hypothetical protein [Streptomyces sp. NBC_00151]|uniref:hypothetical protein n=1 Tax=Streptomyces sp. NBC_00151 TaxID=2975669 RepID=UPI002DDB4D20|nr:hypothetical protein [Streptomyces sp. NBC_00151]WRZ42417.1 hypothetical protein OG915_32895 [Streptomyces sp. NBC_00151]